MCGNRYPSIWWALWKFLIEIDIFVQPHTHKYICIFHSKYMTSWKWATHFETLCTTDLQFYMMSNFWCFIFGWAELYKSQLIKVTKCYNEPTQMHLGREHKHINSYFGSCISAKVAEIYFDLGFSVSTCLRTGCAQLKFIKIPKWKKKQMSQDSHVLVL